MSYCMVATNCLTQPLAVLYVWSPEKDLSVRFLYRKPFACFVDFVMPNKTLPYHSFIFYTLFFWGFFLLFFCSIFKYLDIYKIFSYLYYMCILKTFVQLEFNGAW